MAGARGANGCALLATEDAAAAGCSGDAEGDMRKQMIAVCTACVRSTTRRKNRHCIEKSARQSNRAPLA